MREKLKKVLYVAAKSNPGDNSGFTLMEMLIVIALIGMVMAFVGTNIMRRYDESRVNATKIQMRQLGNSLDDFRRVCGSYPSTDQGLDALIHQPAGGKPCKNYDPEGFLKDHKLPKDAWDNDFSYESDGSKYVIKSFGSDGKPGGDGFAKDISTDDADF